jgi:hypothetical protein
VDVRVTFLVRNDQGKWLPDGPPVAFFDDPATAGDERARRECEQWIAQDPEAHRCDVDVYRGS